MNLGAYISRANSLRDQLESYRVDVAIALEASKRTKDPAYLKNTRKARNNFNAFMEHCFVDTETMTPIKQGDIHRRWNTHINNNNRAMILGPREHGKTEQVVVGRVLYALGRNPQLRVKIVCQDDDSARKRLGAIKQHIETNTVLHDVFPNLKPHPLVCNWAKGTITIARQGVAVDPSVEACGILSSGVGGRADLIIFDDVVDFKNAISQPALREQVKEVFQNVWINLLTKNGRAIYIATPWHQDDLTADLQSNPEWAVLVCAIDEDLTPIWPEQWSKERLQSRRNEIGMRAFARGFLLVAFTDEDQIFASIEFCVHPEYSVDDIDPEWPRYTGVDLGHSKRKLQGGKLRVVNENRPYTVIFTIAVAPDKKKWVLDIRRGHWSGPETAHQLIAVHEDLDSEIIGVENNAYQDTLLDWIKEIAPDKSIRLKPFTTGKNKADESIGLPSLAAEFDNGSWVIPTDGHPIEECHAHLFAWYKEMKYFPAMSLSDTVMACWFAREMFRSFRRAFVVGDDEGGENNDTDWRTFDARERLRGR